MRPFFNTSSGILLTAAILALWPAAPAHADDLIVSAAASLTNAFKTVGDAYEKQHPETRVLLNFGASDVLMHQIVNGAPADVFASADQKAMDLAAQKQAIVPASRKNFAVNTLVLIVPTDSKLALHTLDDLRQPAVTRVAYGDPASVPVGRYARGALSDAGLWQVVSAKGVLAANVRQSLDYVARGEVDAGFVFSTDAAIMPGQVKIAFTVPTTTPISYPLAVVADAKHASEANRFSAFVLSPAGQRILAGYGFSGPR